MVATEYLSHNKFLRVTRSGHRWIGWWRFNVRTEWHPVADIAEQEGGHMSPVSAMDAARKVRTNLKRDMSRTTRHRI